MSVLGKILGAGISAASKYGKLDSYLWPYAVKYTDEAGTGHYLSIVLAKEKQFDKGLTLLFLGDVDERIVKEAELQ